MNYLIIGLAILMILCLAGFVYYLRRRLKNKKIPEIPQEMLDDFNLAEQMLKENHNTMTPQQILWELYKQKNPYVAEQLEKSLDNVPEIKKYDPQDNKPLDKPKLDLRKLFKS